MNETRSPRPAVEIDTSVAHPARVYNYWLGGKDNYAPDRVLAEAMIAQLPTIPVMARANRDFLRRAVCQLVIEHGVRQFLDVGSGIPTANNVHQVAQHFTPDSRVVYVDNDPIVLAHSRALMTSMPEGRTTFITGDAREPQAILDDPAVFATLDRTQPIALMLISVLMYFADDEAYSIVTTLLDALPSGSYVAISHPTADFNPEAAAQAVAVADRSGIRYVARSRADVERFFDRLDLVAPGVVPMLSWHLPMTHPDPESVYYWVGMARKP